MTLLGLQKRVNDIVAYNLRHEWGVERNDLPVLLSVRRKVRNGSKSKYYPAEFLLGSSMTVAQQKFACEITTSEVAEVRRW